MCVKHVHVPKYDTLMRSAGLQGTVDVEVEVWEDGGVRAAKASGGPTLLNEDAEANMREWTFCPSLQSRHFVIKYVYRLEGEPGFHPESEVSLDLPDKVTVASHPEALER